MAVRTNDAAVRDIIESESTVSMEPFIASASVVVDWLETQDLADEVILTATALELIERWLAAHYYEAYDRQYSSKSVGGASGSFQGQTAMVFMSTKYGQNACSIDCTMRLAERSAQVSDGMKRTARVTWGGRNADSLRPDGVNNTGIR